MLETAGDLKDRWRFIAKSVKNLVLYDLPKNTKFGLVTFSNTTNIDVPLTVLDQATRQEKCALFDLICNYFFHIRSRISDIVPDKYRLSESYLKCVECGLRAVLNNFDTMLYSTHIILVTSNDTISDTISSDIMDYINSYQVPDHYKYVFLFLELKIRFPQK